MNNPKTKGEKFATFLVRIDTYLTLKLKQAFLLKQFKMDIMQQIIGIAIQEKIITEKEYNLAIDYATKQSKIQTQREKIINIKDIKRTSIH